MSLSLVCFQLLIDGAMGANLRHEQSMCSLDKRVPCPQVGHVGKAAAQDIGLSERRILTGLL